MQNYVYGRLMALNNLGIKIAAPAPNQVLQQLAIPAGISTVASGALGAGVGALVNSDEPGRGAAYGGLAGAGLTGLLQANALRNVAMKAHGGGIPVPASLHAVNVVASGGLGTGASVPVGMAAGGLSRLGNTEEEQA